MVDRHHHLTWEEHSRQKLAGFGLFDIYTTRRTSHEKQEADFLLVDAPDWVTIVPYRESSDSFLMVRQYRHGSGAITLEFPAGVVHRGEAPEVAARRELREETGCTPTTIVNAGSVNPNPAFMTNEVHTFVAIGLDCGDALDLDDTEILEVETVPVAKVVKELGRPPFTNGIMVISLTWFLRWREAVAEGRQST